jgi:hypothetical protein
MLESGDKTARIEVEDGLGENGAIVIDGFNQHTILKGFEVELFKKGCL